MSNYLILRCPFCLIGVVDNLGKEQFIALYLTSGVIAAFSSQVFRVLMKQSTLSLGAVRKLHPIWMLHAVIFLFLLMTNKYYLDFSLVVLWAS